MTNLTNMQNNALGKQHATVYGHDGNAICNGKLQESNSDYVVIAGVSAMPPGDAIFIVPVASIKYTVFI